MKYLLLLLAITGCSTFELPMLQQGGTGNVYYKKDLKFTVNGESFEGLAVLNTGTSYAFSIAPEKPFDLFTAATCHREIDADQVTIEKKSRWFGASNKQVVRFEYTPRLGLETGTYCGLEIGVYDKDNGQEYWGFIDFNNDIGRGLDALVYCNGEKLAASNSAICQSRAGLIQKVSFNEPVEVLSDCSDFETEDSLGFKFQMPYESCVSLFHNENGMFRLTTFGYNRIKIKDYGSD